jgi:hypothetical protein
MSRRAEMNHPEQRMIHPKKVNHPETKTQTQQETKIHPGKKRQQKTKIHPERVHRREKKRR